MARAKPRPGDASRARPAAGARAGRRPSRHDRSVPARRREREPSRATAAAARVLRYHRRDVWGLASVSLGIVVALGVYVDQSGPLGRSIRLASGALVGLGRYVLPVVAVLVGGVLLTGSDSSTGLVRTPGSPTGERPASPVVRVAVGLPILFGAWIGLLHIFSDAPVGDGTLDSLRRAGGLLGALVGGTLEAGLARWGAASVLICIATLGFIVASGISVRRVLRGCGVSIRWAMGSMISSIRALGSLEEYSRPSRRAPVDAVYADDADDPVDAMLDLGTDAPRSRGGDRARRDRARDARVVLSLYDQGDHGDQVHDAAPAPEHPVEVAGSAPSTPATPAGPSVEAAGRRTRPRTAPVDDAPPVDGEQLAMRLGAEQPTGHWKLPPLGLLSNGAARPIDRKLVEEGGRTLEATLHQFGVEASLVGMTVGPTVTRYELELAAGVKVNKVTSLTKDISYAMASADVRILAPIPGRSAIGVEVPNRQRQLVSLGGILSSPEAAAAVHPLEVGIGRDIAGRPVTANMATMPHVLIAGATGAGKSSCINSIITSILMRATPDQVRMILIDPKRVELTAYNDLPHLLTAVVVDPKKAANALDWAVREMERRYDVLSEVGVRDITGYNAAYDRGELAAINGAPSETTTGEPRYERLPFILIVVDELNDLMMVAARDVETSICRIAQMARAVGIHLVIATQRPSVDVITGVIKANVPSRLAFSVSSIADSRVILDQAGAEKLIGKGDMLLLAASSGTAQRIQGAWIDEADIRKVSIHWKRQVEELSYVDGIAEGGPGGPDATGGSTGGGGTADDVDDDLIVAAMEMIVRSQLGSTSMLQRKLRVGFARAGRIMDLLEQRGVVGPSEGSKARTVLMTVDEYEQSLALRS